MIQQIEISNFKSIRHLKMEGCRRINVLIGPPNVGKSNILEALGCYAFAHTSFGADRNAASLFRIEKLTHLYHNYNNNIPFRVDINDITLIGSYVKSRPKHPEGIDIEEIDEVNFRCVEKNNEKSINRIFHYTLFENLTLSNLHFDPAKLTQVPETNSIAGQIAKYKYEGAKVGSKPGKRYKDLTSPFGENLYTLLMEDQTLKEETQELFNSNGLILVNDSLDDVVKFYLKGSNTIIPFSLVADTVNRLFFHRAAIKYCRKSSILLEEPEAHCYPPYISKMLKEVIFDENDNQFFIITHSPYVLNELMEQAQEETAFFIVNMDNDGSTTVQQLNRDEVHRAYQYGYDIFMNMEDFSRQNEVVG